MPALKVQAILDGVGKVGSVPLSLAVVGKYKLEGVGVRLYMWGGDLYLISVVLRMMLVWKCRNRYLKSIHHSHFKIQ